MTRSANLCAVHAATQLLSEITRSCLTLNASARHCLQSPQMSQSSLGSDHFSRLVETHSHVNWVGHRSVLRCVKGVHM